MKRAADEDEDTMLSTLLREKKQKYGSGPPSKKLFVGNLKLSVNEKHIIKIFQQYGEVRDIKFIWHKVGANRGKPMGFCFVELDEMEGARRAMNELKGRSLFGRKLHVDFARPDPAVTFAGATKRHRRLENERDGRFRQRQPPSLVPRVPLPPKRGAEEGGSGRPAAGGGDGAGGEDDEETLLRRALEEEGGEERLLDVKAEILRRKIHAIKSNY